MSKTGEQYSPALSAAYLKSPTPSSFQCIVKLNEFNGFMKPQWCLWIFWSCHISLHFRL